VHELLTEGLLFSKFGAREVICREEERRRQDEFASTADVASGASFLLALHITTWCGLTVRGRGRARAAE